MAQVNAAGKLMGQEKNQLINAGFSLKIIADEAGVSMTNFAKAMEEGAISAKHVNDALIKATSEGGLYFGRLEKKSQTLNGQLDLVANNFNDLFANLGESKSGFFSTILNQLNQTLSDVSSVISKANELEKLRLEVEELRARSAGKEPARQQEKESYKSYMTRGMTAYSQAKSSFTLFPDEAKARFPGITKAADHFVGMTAATVAFFDELTTSAEDAEAKRKAQIQSLQKEKSILKQRVGDEPTKGTGGDPNLLAGTTAENLADAAKEAAGLPGNLGPGTIDEYNFIRDKMMEDRNLALKSLQEQKEQTKQLRILNGQGAGGRPEPGVWSPRYSRRNSKHQQAMRIRAGLAPQSMMPGIDALGYAPIDQGNVPMQAHFGMSAEAQVRSRFQSDRRALYDKWKMTDAVQTSEGSYGTTMSQAERRGYEEEGGELRRLFKRDLAKAKEQDESTNEWAKFLGTSFKETITEQTRQLTGGEDKQLEGVD
jgi:tape measure domain-containing protein